MDKQLVSGDTPVKTAKELSRIVETVTCLECCKLYVLPETATCGHTLCHGCWIGRQTCPICASHLSRRALKPNETLNKYTKFVQRLKSSFEKKFGLKLEEVTQDPPVQTMNVKNKDSTKNVRAWLADSQNQFSAPISTQQSTQAESFAVEVKTCDIQVHTDSKKPASSVNVVLAPVPPQDDWDKIETIPDTEDITINKENVLPTNQELLSFNDEEYSMDHPRRSSRKKEYKKQHSKTGDNSTDKHSSSNMSVDTDKLSKTKQNWSNVKRMRKEFSKLHKKNKNKLNVSIEMCKKTQSTICKPATAPAEIVESQQAVIIDDCTPNIHLEKQEPLPIMPNLDKAITVQKIKHDEAMSDFTEEKKYLSTHKQQKVDQGMCASSVDLIENSKDNVPFLKKSALQRQGPTDLNTANAESTNHTINCNTQTLDSDDIQITIKIGSTLTNIFIKKKKNDVQVKLNTDQEVQTSTQCVEKSVLCDMSPSANKECDVQDIEINIGDKHVVSAVTQQINDVEANANKKNNLDKTVSTKKNTASAETVPFEITESVEKELSKIMECDSETYSAVQNEKNTQISQQTETGVKTASKVVREEVNPPVELDEDIFASGSVKEGHVQLLKETKPAASEIIMATLKQNKTPTLRQADKRERETLDDDIASNKKLKVAQEIYTDHTVEIRESNRTGGDGDHSMNYDLVMGQVFASIDADMENVDKSQSIIKVNESIVQTEVASTTAIPQHSQQLKTQRTQKKVLGVSILANSTQNVAINFHQKESENLFTQSMRESQLEHQQKHGPETQAHIENLLTPGTCRDLAGAGARDDLPVQATPGLDKDDSDTSIYEDTPQKASFTKPPSTTRGTRQARSNTQKSPAEHPATQSRSIINISDTENKPDKDITVVESKPKRTLETPTMNQFYDQIKHNSTPVARKSLNFLPQDQTLDKSVSRLSRNTQEQELIAKAFEPTPKSFAKPLPVFPATQKMCLAASCLTQAEVKVLETLCSHRKWTFVREYTKDLTHLVVGVDNEGRSQRTVKFMCAVATGKWILRYEWVTECIKRGTKVSEWPYEALDWTGEPGPRRARAAGRRLFAGFTFFCKPPFTVLNEPVLKTMLEGAGATVVSEARLARVAGDAVRLLLAEPEHTQENQFTYLALELNIVPVNYEWALNCLGSYTLSSILDLLLCPASLLPAATRHWPAVLVTPEDESE